MREGEKKDKQHCLIFLCFVFFFVPPPICIHVFLRSLQRSFSSTANGLMYAAKAQCSMSFTM